MTPEEENDVNEWLELYSDAGMISYWDEIAIIESLEGERTRPLDSQDIEYAIDAYINVKDASLSNEERGWWASFYRELMKDLGWDSYDAHKWVDDLTSSGGTSA